MRLSKRRENPKDSNIMFMLSTRLLEDTAQVTRILAEANEKRENVSRGTARRLDSCALRAFENRTSDGASIKTLSKLPERANVTEKVECDNVDVVKCVEMTLKVVRGVRVSNV